MGEEFLLFVRISSETDIWVDAYGSDGLRLVGIGA